MAKVFCIGFQKTGTVSAGRALAALGYRVCDARYDLIEPVRNGDLDAVRAVADQYDAVRDNPWPLLFRELDRMYPKAKFILTRRDEARWIRSVVNHLGVGPDRMQRLVYGRGAPGGFEDTFLERYRRHNAEVMDYFRSRRADLLVVDWEAGHGWPELCSFLGRACPAAPFPHDNKRSYTSVSSRFNFAAARAVGIARRLTGRFIGRS